MTERIKHQRDAVDTRSAPNTNGNGSAPVRAPVETAGAARHRQVGLAANLRLAVLCVMIVAVGAGAGYIGALVQPKQYAARAELQYKLSQAVPNELLREDRRLSTQLVLLGSRDVLGPVSADNGMAPEELAENVSAQVLAGSEIIEVEVRDRTREHAQMLLTGIIDRYLGVANKDWADPVGLYLESQLSDVQQQLRASDGAEGRPAALVQKEQVLLDLLDSLLSRPSNSPQSLSGPPARILTAPYQVDTQVRPKPLVAVATGSATALVVAGFVVLLVVRRRLRS